MHISLRLMKKALLHPPYPKRVRTRFFPSFVLVSPTSSMYSTGKERILVRLGWAGETGTSAVLASPAASLGDLFDHPVASVKPLRTTASRRIAMNHPG
jgi:hypothetical protein